MRVDAVAFAAVLGVLAAAQQPQRPAKSAATPVHQPHANLPPAAALEHLRAGNASVCAARAGGTSPAPTRPRPSGAGRYVVAVVTCADAPVDPATVLGLRAVDVLQFRTAGAHVDAATVALLEQAVAQERLSLIVVLTHADCRSLQPAAGTPVSPAQAVLQERAVAAATEADRRRLPLAKAQALRQCEALVAASEPLQRAVAGEHLLVVPAEVGITTLAVTWHQQNADRLPLAPVK